MCEALNIGGLQESKFNGSWVDHPASGHAGLYDMQECPDWAIDFDCRKPNNPAMEDPDLVAREYRKVFMPDKCQLREFDGPGFDRCMKGRRLIMIGGSCRVSCAHDKVSSSLPHGAPVLTLPGVPTGDSLMRQNFASLACLLAKVMHRGHATYWEDSDVKHQGVYPKKWGDSEVTTLKQFVGDVELLSGGQVVLRSFGTYNAKLWDDVLSDFEPLTADDIVMVNFGAWCGDASSPLCVPLNEKKTLHAVPQLRRRAAWRGADAAPQ